MPQQTNTPPEPPLYWWPIRAVEISLPMTNQPLTNYTIRTLWTCKPTDEVAKGDTVPSSIRPTLDGRYLAVDVRLYQQNTSGEVFVPWPWPTCIYDVEQSKFLNFPPAKEWCLGDDRGAAAGCAADGSEQDMLSGISESWGE